MLQCISEGRTPYCNLGPWWSEPPLGKLLSDAAAFELPESLQLTLTYDPMSDLRKISWFVKLNIDGIIPLVFCRCPV